MADTTHVTQHRESCDDDHTDLERRPFVNAIVAQKLCGGFDWLRRLVVWI